MLGRITLALLLLLLVGVGPVHAQAVFPIMGPGGTLVYSDASITAANSSSQVSMFQYLIPPAYVATASSTGAAATQIFTGGTPSGLSVTGGGVTPTGALSVVPQPLHFRAVGLLAGAAGTSLAIGVNLNDGIAPPSSGAGTATVSLNNSIIGTIAGPGTLARLDVYVVPIATGTATPNNPNNAMLTARFSYVNSSGTETVVNSTVLAGVNFASPTRMNVLARWSAAASDSTLTFFSRVLRLME